MRFCRLCGEYKTAEELVVSLEDPIRILTFRDVVEYYCQCNIDNSPELEQRACRSCKRAIDRFAEFSCKVELHQKKLQNRPEIIILKEEENDFSKDAIESEPEEIPFEVVEVKAASQQEFINEGPATKKLKKTEVEDSAFIPAITAIESDKGAQLKLRRSLRKSVCEKEQPNTGGVLEKSLLETVDTKDWVHIDISKTKLMKDGEVPNKWMAGYENFTKWEDFTYVCKKHCKMKFDGLLAYSMHQKEIRLANRSISCNLCDHRPFQHASYLSSYINHMATHFLHLKFCCIFCSRVFYNMVALSKHYKSCQKNVNFGLFPCLECGAYRSSKSQLKIHKASHKGK